MMSGIGFLKTLGSNLGRDDAGGLAAEMTYNLMLSLIPALIFIFTLFGMFGVNSTMFDQVMSRLHLLVPRDAYDLIEATFAELTKASTGSVAFVSFFGALWTASNGAHSIQKALNRAFTCVDKKRGAVREHLVAFLIVIGLAFLLFVCANLIVFGDVIFDLVKQTLPLQESVLNMLGWLRWGIAIGGLMLIISFIYYIAPDLEGARIPIKRRVLPGALTFVPLWILISWLFGVYVSNLANFNKVYGPMGAIVILMTWLYLTSYTLIIGGEVNAIACGCSKDDQQAQPRPLSVQDQSFG